MRIFLTVTLLLLALSAEAQRYSALTSTNRVTSTNLIAVEMFPNATNGTKSITVSNLAISLGPYITNSAGGGSATNAVSTVRTNGGAISTAATDLAFIEGTNIVLRATNAAGVVTVQINSTGGSSGVTTNANQFGAASALTLKSGPLVTNVNLYGTTAGLGKIDAEGGVALPNSTASRVAILNGVSDLTNSPGVSTTELEYLDGVTSAVQTQLDGKLTNSRYALTLVVDSQYGNDSTGQTNSHSFPYRTLRKAFTNLTHNTRIVVRGEHDEPAFIRSTDAHFTNGPPVRSPWGLTNVLIEFEGRARVRFTNQGTSLVIWAGTNWLLKGGWISGTITNVADVAHQDNSFIAHYGQCDKIVYDDMWVSDTEAFAIMWGGTSISITRNGIFRGGSIWNAGVTNWSAIGNVPEGGYMQISGHDTLIEDTKFWHGARGIEPYNSQISCSNVTVRGCSFYDTHWKDFFIDSGIQWYGGLFENNTITPGPWSRPSANASSVVQINMCKDFIFRNNTLNRVVYGLWSTPAANFSTENFLAENNTFNGYLIGATIGVSGESASPGTIYRGNKFINGTNQAIRVMGSNVVLEGNYFINASTVAGAAGSIQFFGNSTNCLISRNYFFDTTSGSSDAAIDLHNGTGTNRGAMVLDNTFVNIAAAVDDAGATDPVYRWFGTNGWIGIGTNSPSSGISIQSGGLEIAGHNVVSNYIWTATNASGKGEWRVNPGAAGGEANVNGEVSVTNATRIGLVHGKTGVTNTLRSLQGGMGVSLTNQGTNIMIAVSNIVSSSLRQLVRTDNLGGGEGIENTFADLGEIYLTNHTLQMPGVSIIAISTNYGGPDKLWVHGNATFNASTVSITGPVSLGALTVTNFVKYIPQTISGAGTGNTNYTLLAGREMYLGSSNVNITAVMDYDEGAVTYWTAVITNLSAITWGLRFSSVTNRWKFLGANGTNAPSVLTNGTMMQLHGRQHGTNITLSYSYWNPAL